MMMLSSKHGERAVGRCCFSALHQSDDHGQLEFYGVTII